MTVGLGKHNVRLKVSLKSSKQEAMGGLNIDGVGRRVVAVLTRWVLRVR